MVYLIMSRTSRRKRGPVRSKKVIYDGIKFASGLEKNMYIALQEAKIKAKYEGQTYELVPSFSFKNNFSTNFWSIFLKYAKQKLSFQPMVNDPVLF